MKTLNIAITVFISAFLLALSVEHATAQKSSAEKALEKAEKDAKDAKDAADTAKDEADKAKEEADKADKNLADKQADKADEDAAKDEQAYRDAQDKADQSGKSKDQEAADKAREKAQESEDKAKDADTKANKGEKKDNPQKNNRDKQRDKRKKDQDAWDKERKLKQLKKQLGISLAPAPTKADTVAALVASGRVTIDSVGTGETIGHIADLKIQNLTDQPLTCAIAPMILESASGNNQHYACPTGQTVALNPHQTKTVPMNGVCLNRNKPPVAKGVSGDLVINEASPSGPQNPNSHLSPADAGKLLRICTSKYDAADQLQKSGALKNLPYHDPQKQKDIVVQWSTWCDPRISQITGAPPATKDDLKKVVYKQVEAKGPMTPETKKKVDQGIDTIFEKVELTTAKAKDLEKPEPLANVELTGEQGKGESSPPTQSPSPSP